MILLNIKADPFNLKQKSPRDTRSATLNPKKTELGGAKAGVGNHHERSRARDLELSELKRARTRTP